MEQLIDFNPFDRLETLAGIEQDMHLFIKQRMSFSKSNMAVRMHDRLDRADKNNPKAYRAAIEATLEELEAHGYLRKHRLPWLPGIMLWAIWLPLILIFATYDLIFPRGIDFIRGLILIEILATAVVMLPFWLVYGPRITDSNFNARVRDLREELQKAAQVDL